MSIDIAYSDCYATAAGNCILDMSGYSEIEPTTYINQCATNDGNQCQTGGGWNYQCPWYAIDRIWQITGINIGTYGAWGATGAEWASTARQRGFPVYSTSEALATVGTLAGLVISTTPGCLAASCIHVAICEGYDPETQMIYVSEMWGGYPPAGRVRLTGYSLSEYQNVSWIDFSSIGFSASGARGGGYFKDKFGEFHWKNKPDKDVLIPLKDEFQSFCDRLNEAQEEARVENIDKFATTDNKSTLTAARFNDMLHLMQTSTEGDLRGTSEDEVEHMEDVSRNDVIKAKHFQQLEDLYNHWKYGTIQSGTDVPMNGTYAERVWDYFRSLGYSEYATAGILGNMMRECGGDSLYLNPTVWDPPHEYYGLCQWGPYYTEIHGASFEDQLRFLSGNIKSVMGNSCYNSFINSSTPAGAARLFDECYEKSTYSATDNALRAQNAQTAYNAFKDRPLWTPSTGGPTGEGTFIWPVAYAGITGNYGTRYHPITGKPEFHMGLDIAAVYTPVWACASGTVVTACNQCEHWSYGMSILINHNNGWYTRYAHLSQLLVSAGQTVSQGQQIAISGDTGSSTAPHLHLELRKGPDMQPATCVNPQLYLSH